MSVIYPFTGSTLRCSKLATLSSLIRDGLIWSVPHLQDVSRLLYVQSELHLLHVRGVAVNAWLFYTHTCPPDRLRSSSACVQGFSGFRVATLCMSYCVASSARPVLPSRSSDSEDNPHPPPGGILTPMALERRRLVLSMVSRERVDTPHGRKERLSFWPAYSSNEHPEGLCCVEFLYRES